MTPDLKNWIPIDPEEIQSHLGNFKNWCLAAGHSIDWIIGRKTREHGDTDIGVFRSELEMCLAEIGQSQVFLCMPPGKLTPWDGSNIPESVYDIWISDSKIEHWILQVMTYEEEGDYIVYRRDPRIRWHRSNHTFNVRGMNVVNPFVNLMFKINKNKLMEKDCMDMMILINEMANKCMQGT